MQEGAAHPGVTPSSPVSFFRMNSSEARGPAVPRSQESGKRTLFGTRQKGPRRHGVCGALSPPHLAVQCCWPEATLRPNRGRVWLEGPSAQNPRAPPWGQVWSECLRLTSVPGVLTGRPAIFSASVTPTQRRQAAGGRGRMASGAGWLQTHSAWPQASEAGASTRHGGRTLGTPRGTASLSATPSSGFRNSPGG